MNRQLAEQPVAVSAIVQSADFHAGNGEFEQALALYREALAIEPANAAARRNMALALGASGQLEAAIETLVELLADAPDNMIERGLLADCLRTVGRTAEAADQYRRILAHEPEAIEALRWLGVCQLGLGQIDSGRRTLQAVLQRRPDDVEANLRLGTNYYDAGDYVRAITHLKRAEAASEAPEIHGSLAEALRSAGRMDEALMAAELLVARHPGYAHGWHIYGVVQLELNDCRGGAEAFRRAIELDPDDGMSVHNLGLCLWRLSDYDAALARLTEAERKLPQSLQPAFERTRLLQELERHAEALPILQELIRQAPEDVDLRNNLAVALMSLRRFDEAQDACERALALEPTKVTSHLTLVKCLLDSDRQAEGYEWLKRTLPMCGTDASKLTIAAGFFEALKQHEEAAELYRQILREEPDNERATARLLDLALSICDWRDYAHTIGEVIDRVTRQIEDHAPTRFDVFNLQALPVSYEFIARAAANRARTVADEVRARPTQAPVARARPAVATRDRIRLAYLLPYTHFHSLPLVLRHIVEQHDRQRLDVVGYCIQPCNDSEFSRGYRGAFDRFTDLPFRNPVAAAAALRDDQIDVLIDVAGLTGANCMPIMALRPAPVQAHYLGYSITTGADYIDYLITDQTYIPPDCRHLCSEQLVYMPDTFMATVRQPIADWRPTRADLGLPDDGVVFANFNHPCKFEPTIFQAWMDILKRVPDSVIWFGDWAPATKRNLWREAQARGVDPDRLVFAGIVPHEWHCARLAQADLALDNRYHGGGITTVDALWSGLPVLTMFGETPSARLGATLVRAAGMPELIVTDLAAYVETAVALARDPDRLADLRARMAAKRDGCALFDTERQTRNLETAYRAMWDNHLAGERPRPIDIDRDGGVRYG